jgi:hypothetical protein
MKSLKKQDLKKLLDDKHYVEFITNETRYAVKKGMSFKGDGNYLLLKNHCIIKRDTSFLVAVIELPEEIECTELYIDTIQQ